MRETGDVRSLQLLRHLVAGGCLYEFVALEVGCWPTLCRFSRTRP